MSQANNSTEKLLDLGAIRENPALETVLKKMVRIKSLAYPPILFPDLVYKPLTEAPASLAVATRGTIVPTLLAPSLGCSMGVIATSLTKEDITPEFERVFYAHMQDELGRSYDMVENILVWLGLKTRPLKKYDLTISEFEDIIKRGADAAIERYDLPKDTAAIFDSDGSLFSEDEQKALNIHRILPRSSFTNGRHDLGYGFKGNHFLELQYVEDIYDSQTAQELGLAKDQVVIMYHGGGGMVPYHVGRYYGNRRKNTLKQKFFQNIGKIFFHFLSPGGLRYFAQRWRYYFTQKLFQEIPLDTPEGQRLLQATKASLNYSYAFNVAIYRRVIDALHNALPEKDTDPRLVVAKIHNVIAEEKINDESVVAHRHTVTRVEPGKPTIISGFNTTHSYIVIGDSGAKDHLFSADHGSGYVHKHLAKEVRTLEHNTTIHKTREPHEQTVQHVSSNGIERVMDLLEKKAIIKRAVALRPLASFKG